MDKIEVIQGTAVVLPVSDVDTDQIIPSRFLKATSRSGFGDALFADWRGEGDFCVNCQSGSILVTGANFGCGSSREHAVWAIYDYGFRAVVGTSFADIFYGNALNNGLLAVEISADFLDFLVTNPRVVITINLAEQTIEAGGRIETFAIDAYKKECLINGFDDIDYLVNIKGEIEDYEIKHCTTAR